MVTDRAVLRRAIRSPVIARERRVGWGVCLFGSVAGFYAGERKDEAGRKDCLPKTKRSRHRSCADYRNPQPARNKYWFKLQTF